MSFPASWPPDELLSKMLLLSYGIKAESYYCCTKIIVVGGCVALQSLVILIHEGLFPEFLGRVLVQQKLKMYIAATYLLARN